MTQYLASGSSVGGRRRVTRPPLLVLVCALGYRCQRCQRVAAAQRILARWGTYRQIGMRGPLSRTYRTRGPLIPLAGPAPEPGGGPARPIHREPAGKGGETR
jgi:hypothetical protein